MPGGLSLISAQHAGPAADTSFSIGCVLSASSAAPFSAPGVPPRLRLAPQLSAPQLGSSPSLASDRPEPSARAGHGSSSSYLTASIRRPALL